MSKIIIQSYTETLAAGETRAIYGYSSMLTILENTAGESISVGIGEMKPVLLRAGIQYELPQDDRFTEITLYNQAAVQTTVSFILSTGRVYDNRLTITGSTFDNMYQELIKITGELQGDTTYESWGTELTVGVAAVSVLLSNATRKACNLQSKESNTGLIYVGFQNTVASNKWVFQLQPGQPLILDDYRGPIFAISDTPGQLLGWGEW